MTICACLVVVNHSALSTSRRRVPLKRLLYPFSQGEPGYIRIGFTDRCQPDQRQPQSIVIFGIWSILQGASRQTNHPAGPSLRRRKLLARMDNGLTELPGRWVLGFK